MAGLLNIDPIAQGLIGAGGALLTPRAMGGGVGAAGTAFNQGLLQAAMMQRQAQQDAMRQRLYEAQIGEIGAQAEQRRMAVEKEREALARQKRIADEIAGGAAPASASQSPMFSMPTTLGFGGGLLAPGGPVPDSQAPSFAPPSQQPASAKPSRLSAFNEYMRMAGIYERNGDLASGTKYREMAQKSMPEVQGRDVVVVNGVPTVRVYFKDGSHEDVTDAAPKADTTLDDFGGTKRLRNNYTGLYEGKDIPVTMTAAQIAQNNIARGQLDVARGNLANSQARLRFDQEAGKRPQILQSENGFVVVQPGMNGGLPTGAPLTSADGTPLKPPAKPAPQFVVEGLSTNAKNLGVIEKALASLKTDAGKNATGWKGYLPGPVLNRTDPEGVETRADIADIGSMTIHSRSGAAVTAAEFPRLQPFIPLATDDHATVVKKLTRMAEIIKEESGVLGAFYPDAARTAAGAVGGTSGVSTTGGRPATGGVLRFDAQGNPVK